MPAPSRSRIGPSSGSQVGRRPVEQPAHELVDVPAQQRGGVLALEVPVDGELLEAALELDDQVVERDPRDDPAQDVVVHAAQVTALSFGVRADDARPAPADPVGMRKILLVSLAIVTVSLAFIASYSAALHAPTPHEVPLAVGRDVPANVAAQLDRSPALSVVRSTDPLRAIDRREAYGALTLDGGRLKLTAAPAASSAIAALLDAEVLPGKVEHATVHALAADDNRGLIGTYTVIGWVIAGYLGATLFGMTVRHPRAPGAAARRARRGRPGRRPRRRAAGQVARRPAGTVARPVVAGRADRRRGRRGHGRAAGLVRHRGDRDRDPAVRRARQPVLRRARGARAAAGVLA